MRTQRAALISDHGSPAFFPCHRGFLLSWLERLRSECNYQGNSLYLDVNTYTDDWGMYDNEDLWGSDNLGSDETPSVGKWVDGSEFLREDHLWMP